MKKSTQRFLGAMGSILDISPAGDYREYRNLPSDSELIAKDWATVGGYLRESISAHESEKDTAGTKRQR